MTVKPNIIIVGAGIVGANLAYRLASQKARVMLLDSAPRPAYEVTKKSFAWITAAYNAPESYFNFHREAIAEWHRLEDDFNGLLKINWSGALSWYKNMADADHIINKLSSLDYKISLVNSQRIRDLEPNLKVVPDQAIFSENEGAIDAVFATQLLINAAIEAGACVYFGTDVFSLTTNGSKITGVVTNKGKFPADITILATGTGTTALCEPLGLKIPIGISPAILLKFHTTHRFVNRIVSNPFMEIRADSDKLLLAAEDYIDDSAENNPFEIANRTLKTIKQHWKGAKQIKLSEVMVGNRPVPQDGQPVIGRAPNMDGLYLSVMHTGVTLAALAGKLAADEILNNQNQNLLSPYRAERFN